MEKRTTNQDPHEYASELLKENRIKYIGKGWFKVMTKTNDYMVSLNRSKCSCTCKYYSIKGIMPDTHTEYLLLCGHIIACIIKNQEVIK